MYFADFETTTIEIDPNKSWVWLWGIKGAMDGDKLVYGTDIEEFLDHCVENKKTTVLFHNLGWDFNYIYKFLLDKKNFRFRDMNDMVHGEVLRNNEFTWLCDNTGSVYSAEVKWKGSWIQFKDSWKVLMASVEGLGKVLGKVKLSDKFDYHHYHDDKEDLCKEDIEYLERDIDIVRECFVRVSNLVKPKLTRAGMAYEHFRNFYGERNFANDFGGHVWSYKENSIIYENILKKDEWELVQRSYQGGYTYWNQKYTDKVVVGDGWSVDVNSLYPAVMMNNMFPYGEMYYTEPKDHPSVSLVIVSIFKAKKKEDYYPALIKDKSKSIDAKYLDEIEMEERVYWEDEFEYIKKYYDIEYVITGRRYFKTKFIFDEWLETVQDYKINAKEKADRDFWKGIYNSLYGKFGQNKSIGRRVIYEDGLKMVINDGEKELIDIETGEVKGKLSNKIRYGPEKTMRHNAEYEETDNLKYIPIASYTTWLARKTLWDGIFANLDIWIYSDTDSCYFMGEPKDIEIHESKFGAWKFEHRFKKFKVLRAKCYMFDATWEWDGGWVEKNETVKKISGISKEGKEEVNWDNFYLGSIIENGKRGTVNVDGGKFVIDSNYKIGKTIAEENEEEWAIIERTRERLFEKLERWKKNV